MAESKHDFSQILDTYLDNSRKTISQWQAASKAATMQRYSGNIIYPVKHPLQLIYTYVMVDAHLSSVVNQRKSKVLSEPFAVVDQAGNINEEATKLLSKQWFNKVSEAIIDARACS